MSELYTSAEVCLLTGATYRQLQHWLRLGLIWPAVPANGSGTVAGYDAEDLRWAGTLARLVSFGVAPGAIAQRLGTREELKAWGVGLVQVVAETLEAAPEWVGSFSRTA